MATGRRQQRPEAAAYRVEWLDGTRPAAAAEISRLHAGLLPTSPVARLGCPFMEGFYYRLLPARGYILAALARVDGEPAGFVAATDDSAGFMRAAAIRHFPALGLVLARSLLLSPRRLAAALQGWRLMRLSPTAQGTASAGEILSMGVVPAHRTTSLPGGGRIADDLLERAIERLRERGVTVVRAIVDADNLAAKLFYHGRGWRLETPDVGGWEVPSVEFVWRQRPCGETAARHSPEPAA